MWLLSVGLIFYAKGGGLQITPFLSHTRKYDGILAWKCSIHTEVYENIKNKLNEAVKKIEILLKSHICKVGVIFRSRLLRRV